MLPIKHLFNVSILITLLVSACLPIQPVITLNPEPVQPTAVITPAFLPTGCLYPVKPEDNVECGFLLVPENRSDPNSRIIRLHLLRFQSASDQPAADPLIVLNGGPGSPGAPVVASLLYDFMGMAWRAEREVIYIDQRGSNFSIPSLQCTEGSIDPEQFVGLQYTAQAELEWANLRACYETLTAQGINLMAYNLIESAADINDLRLALGYDQVNLYGFSYGSLLAMTVMRNYPEGVRSVVLDAILPPGVDLRCEKPRCIQGALDALFSACAADTACHAAYPELERVFYAVADRLRAAPVQIPLTFLGEPYQVTLDDLKFVNHLVHNLQLDAIGRLPAEIYAAYQGDYSAPAETWLGYAMAQEASRHRGENSAPGLYYSTLCSYLNSYPTPAAAPSESVETLHPSLAAYVNDAFGGCAVWPMPPLDADLATQPVVSAIPTLLLVGAFDPGLPPYLSEAAAGQLSNGYYFTLPVGHGAVFSPCGLQLITTFLADPMTRPDDQCIGEMEILWRLPPK